MRVPALAIVGCVVLAGCNNPMPEQDRPNPGTTGTPARIATAQNGNVQNGDQAAINATPQVSLTEQQRAELRELAKSYIDDAAAENTQGFTAVSGVQDEVVALQPTQVHNWTVQLQRGQSYRIIGGCDNECTDMDFELLDSSGKIIERDTLPDSFPIINVTPQSAGAYTVRFLMKTCTIAPCYAAGRLYHQTGSTTAPARASNAA
ncbi:hypothetical protein ACETK8_00300 [Brevundimonas staleyi]|uniref:Lipoprotein n=1 Tax=Brevundimonas staleyi TaxID=74326 RepID=A0ABW0FUI0_9CAUL